MTVNKIRWPEGIKLRPVQAEDGLFLLELFKSTREYLRLLLPKSQLDLMIAQQFLLQQNSYAVRYPRAGNFIIQLNGTAIGKLSLDNSANCLRIIDVAIIETQRSKGYGKAIINAIQDYALIKKSTVRLSVDVQNSRAKNLYVSLGFIVDGVTETHESMIWNAGLEP